MKPFQTHFFLKISGVSRLKTIKSSVIDKNMVFGTKSLITHYYTTEVQIFRYNQVSKMGQNRF